MLKTKVKVRNNDFMPFSKSRVTRSVCDEHWNVSLSLVQRVETKTNIFKYNDNNNIANNINSKNYSAIKCNYKGRR